MIQKHLYGKDNDFGVQQIYTRCVVKIKQHYHHTSGDGPPLSEHGSISVQISKLVWINESSSVQLL